MHSPCTFLPVISNQRWLSGLTSAVFRVWFWSQPISRRIRSSLNLALHRGGSISPCRNSLSTVHRVWRRPPHCGTKPGWTHRGIATTKPGHYETSNHSLSHKLESEWANECAQEPSEQCRGSKWMSSASKRANERTDERMAQNLGLDFWLFWPIVHHLDDDYNNDDHEYNDYKYNDEWNCGVYSASWWDKSLCQFIECLD